MVEPVRHRQTKGAETDMFEPKATASHLDSTQMRSAEPVEQCPSSEAKRKTSTRDEYFAFLTHFGGRPDIVAMNKAPAEPGL